MIFSSPSFLWALGLLAIPIIIHLFQFRRFRVVYFPDISLLKEVQTKSQTKNQLKHLLVLFSRLLFLALLITSFAEPKIPAKGNHTASDGQTVSIYLDNSLSMQSRVDELDLITIATQNAYDIAVTYPSSTKFRLITNDFNSTQRKAVDFETFVSLLDEVGVSPKFRTIDDVLQFHNQSASDLVANQSLFLLSDFIGNLDTLHSKSDSALKYRYIAYSSSINSNTLIDSLWIESPVVQVGNEAEVFVRVRNFSKIPVLELPVSLVIGEENVSTVLIDIEPNSFKDTSITLIADNSGNINGKVFIEDNTLEFDNESYFSIQVKDDIVIQELSGSEKPSPLKNLFDIDGYSYRNMSLDGIRIDSILNPDLLIINEANNISGSIFSLISRQLENGKSVLVVLSEKTNSESQDRLRLELGLNLRSWDTTRILVNSIETKDKLYFDVFEQQPKNLNFPYSKGYWRAEAQNSRSLLRLFNGNDLLQVLDQDNGALFVISGPLSDDFTNFHKHALFVPSIINMPIYTGIAGPLSFPIGIDYLNIKLPDSKRITLVSDRDGNEFFPGVTYNGLAIHDQELKPGFYRLVSDSSDVFNLAFNFDRSESRIDALSVEEIQNRFERNGFPIQLIDNENQDFSAEIYSADFGTELWPYFLLAALLCFLVESLFLKLFP